MKIQNRIRILKVIKAQKSNINIISLPRFNSNLFSARPDIIQNFDLIVKKINDLMLSLDNTVDFTIVYKKPSLAGSRYVNSLKNLVNLSKWLYDNILTAQRIPYTVEDLIKIFKNFSTTVNSYSFPEPELSSAKSELSTLATNALSKL